MNAQPFSLQQDGCYNLTSYTEKPLELQMGVSRKSKELNLELQSHSRFQVIWIVLLFAS